MAVAPKSCRDTTRVTKGHAMSASIRELGIDRMTREQRIALALEIWESLGDERPAGLSDDQRAELARRAAELDGNPGLAVPWEQIRAAVRRHVVTKGRARWTSRRKELCAAGPSERPVCRPSRPWGYCSCGCRLPHRQNRGTAFGR